MLTPAMAVTNTSPPIHKERIGKRGPDPVSDGSRRFNARDFGDADRELVPSEATGHPRRPVRARMHDRVVSAHTIGESLCRQLEDLVAKAMSECIVDFLEAIEVKEDDRQ